MIDTKDLVVQDVEEIVLGQILFDRENISTAARYLKSEHFGVEENRMVFDACIALWRGGVGVDLITITTELQRRKQLQEVGGAPRLAGFSARVAASTHLVDHCAILREFAALRALREAGDKLRESAVMGEDPKALLGSLNADIEQASFGDEGTNVNAAEVAYALMNTADRPKPIYMGVAALDELVFVLPGNVVTIRGAAGSGKTAFLLSVIMNLLPMRKTWFVSLEMPATEVMTRALCALAKVDIDMALVNQIDEREREAMAQAASQNAGMLSNLIIDDAGTMNVDVFKAKAEHMVKNEKVELIAIDYAQLMDADKKVYPSTVLQLEAISKMIRATARTLNVPILCIVHVNKEGQDHGTIQFEKDAHVRLHLEREKGADMMSIDILKNRNGRVGLVHSPCVMRWGIVGRVTGPNWPVVQARNLPDPNNRIEPQRDETAPF